MIQASLWAILEAYNTPDIDLSLLFSLFINALSRYLTDIAIDKRIHHGLPKISPFNHILFADDMNLLAQDKRRYADSVRRHSRVRTMERDAGKHDEIEADDSGWCRSQQNEHRNDNI